MYQCITLGRIFVLIILGVFACVGDKYVLQYRNNEVLQTVDHLSSNGLHYCGSLCLRNKILCVGFQYFTETKLCKLYKEQENLTGTQPEKIYIDEKRLCMHPLIDGARDRQITASSVYNWDVCFTEKSRLNAYGAWCSVDLDVYQWIKIDFESEVRANAIATQARYDRAQMLTVYRLTYYHAQTWTNYKESDTHRYHEFIGNLEWSNEVKKHKFLKPFDARKIRLHPLEWIWWISLRWEIYGCKII